VVGERPSSRTGRVPPQSVRLSSASSLVRFVSLETGRRFFSKTNKQTESWRGERPSSRTVATRRAPPQYVQRCIVVVAAIARNARFFFFSSSRNKRERRRPKPAGRFAVAVAVVVVVCRTKQRYASLRSRCTSCEYYYPYATTTASEASYSNDDDDGGLVASYMFLVLCREAMQELRASLLFIFSARVRDVRIFRAKKCARSSRLQKSTNA